MVQRRRGLRPVVRSTKRRVTWEGTQVDLAGVAVGGSLFQTAVTEAIFENFPNPTVVRVRGEIMVINDATSSAGAFGHIACGLMLVDAKALAIGITALELPATDVGSDWLWWDCFTFGEQIANEVDNSGLNFNRKQIDNKAMRVVQPNQALVFVAEIVKCEGTTLVGNVCGEFRVLLKAP